jgi:hypothetical protein
VWNTQLEQISQAVSSGSGAAPVLQRRQIMREFKRDQPHAYQLYRLMNGPMP